MNSDAVSVDAADSVADSESDEYIVRPRLAAKIFKRVSRDFVCRCKSRLKSPIMSLCAWESVQMGFASFL